MTRARKKIGQVQQEGQEFANSQVDEFKKRMLLWLNPVEFVNNMYSCHPGDEKGSDYFQEVFA